MAPVHDDVDLSELTNEPAVAKFKVTFTKLWNYPSKSVDEILSCCPFQEHSTMNFNTMDQRFDRELIKNIEENYFKSDFDSGYDEVKVNNRKARNVLSIYRDFFSMITVKYMYLYYDELIACAV